MSNNPTFAALERAAGQNYSPPEGDKWPLQEWYDRIRNVPIAELSAGDLAKACRQDLWTDHVVPWALTMLQSDPKAGELYNGELLVALKYVPITYWSANPATAKMIRQLIESSLSQFDDDVVRDAKELLRTLP